MKKLIAIITCIILVAVFFIETAFAGTFSDTSVNKGQGWTYINSYYTWVGEEWTLGGWKYTYYRYKGTNYNFSAYHALTENTTHYQGESNQSITYSTQWTVTTSGNGTLPGSFGATLGFQYSYTSSQGVTDKISSTLKDGWYYYGVKHRLRDFKVSKKTEYYVISGTTPSSTSWNYYYGPRVDYTGSGSLPVYKTWVFDSNL